ncbi:hypothetical protein SAMD00019534_032940 [Acytostelium subglobosum LB1]|uniref:hypothetical protein n=1 Tax=Acytostelium subglobosum LB1 TaxID=1410327 RepID=UPI000644EFEA|nr:hypothetical protein SAMD00019534_032940 [Acytostelium subglobosum LB1]GAM20119.1 hypothetical protein SAMD00019534_032940 [Acytostelium subglobosum LB1]|eukprot:XP_012756881.1 hypothetical protein SAMD00019534_032940 [Acytostelium subglobosum LB1]
MKSTLEVMTSILQEVNQLSNLQQRPYEDECSSNESDTKDAKPEECSHAQVVKMIRSIQSLVPLDQNTSDRLNSSTDESPKQLSDYDLLHAIQECSEMTKSLNYSQTKLLQIKIDDTVTNKIMSNIEKCFTLIDSHEFHNHYFSLTANSCKLYHSTLTNPLNIKEFKPRSYIEYATVYASNNVYVFGGTESPNTYSRLYLPELRWYNDLPITSIDGGQSISTCYDGDRHIYLVGGIINGYRSNRVDRFNIVTQQFSHVGSLPTPLNSAGVFFHSGKLYVIGGYHTNDTQLGTILSFDVTTPHCDIHTYGLNVGQSISHFFDGKDIYLLSTNGFFRVNLASKEVKGLTQPKSTDYHKLFFDGKIRLLVGIGNNMEYSKESDNWKQLNDNYRSEPLGLHAGMCLINS